MWAEQIEAIFCIQRKVVVGLSSQHWQEGQKINLQWARQKGREVFYFHRKVVADQQKRSEAGSENQFAGIF
jgi:hypothetical protein